MEKRIEEYDVVVIGGGAAGMTAALYAGRARLKTILIEKSLIGGLATYTSEVENYPGFPEGIDGTELMKLFDKQFRRFGVDVKLTDVKSVEDRRDIKVVSTFRIDYHAKAVIVATGGKPRLTGARNEDQFLDKGISFCATCDAARYTGKKVMVIGSGDAAIEEGMFLTRFAREVWVSVIHDEGKMDANEVAREKALANPKMHFLWNTSVDGFEGDELLKTVVLKNLKTGELQPVDVDGCFLFIGYLPNTGAFKGLLDMDERGYLITNEDMETNVPGIFAAGDVRQKTLRQVATSVGDGAIAGYMAERYMADLEVIEQKILRKDAVVLAYIYNASEEHDRTLLTLVEGLHQEFKEKCELQLVDVYKSDKVARALACPSVPSVYVVKHGQILACIGVGTDKQGVIIDEARKLLRENT
ncbi:FAD-dependent oxidoreductase [Treponema sp. OttesenSCG-928-L16]|nr:FAD-dependent oxidoreductase [Treponema sp. OttesenSCG-928-L16]